MFFQHIDVGLYTITVMKRLNLNTHHKPFKRSGKSRFVLITIFGNQSLKFIAPDLLLKDESVPLDAYFALLFAF